jgi:hypothetical protein
MTHEAEVAAWRALLELGDAVGRMEKAKDEPKDEDDHYYGAWVGGSKRSGGHPGSAGTRTQPRRRAVPKKPDEDGADAVRKIRDLAAGKQAEKVKPEDALAPKDAPQGGVPVALTAFERDIMAKEPKVEWGQVFDKDGNPITPPTKGGSNSIHWVHGANPQEWRGAYLTHLHPTSSSGSTARAADEVMSLSARDISTALDTSLASIRAFTTDGHWMELRNTGYEFNSYAFDGLFKDKWAAAKRGQWWSKPMSSGPDFDRASRAYFAAYRDTIISTVNAVRGASTKSPSGPGSRYFDGLEIRTGKL